MITLPDKLNVYMASDFAVTEPRDAERDPDYTEHGVFGLGGDGDCIFVLDWWSGQTTPDTWIESLLDLQAKWKPFCWFGEGGVIRRAVEPFLTKRARERKVFCRAEWLSPIHDKATRGRAFQARASMGRVIFPKAEPWAERVIDQCVAFPGAAHDDKFDVLALMCLAVDQAHPAIVQGKATRQRDAWAEENQKAAVRQWRVV